MRRGPGPRLKKSVDLNVDPQATHHHRRIQNNNADASLGSRSPCLDQTKPNQKPTHLPPSNSTPSLTSPITTHKPFFPPSDAFLGSRSPCLDQIGTPVMRQVVFGGLGNNTEVGEYVDGVWKWVYVYMCTVNV